MATPHDRQVLNSVLNPLMPIGEGVYDDENQIPKELTDNEQESEAIKRSRELEVRAITACEAGRMSEALSLLNEAVAAAPDRPACYNNRAQVHRLLGDTPAAMADLNKTIELSQALLHRLDNRMEDAMEDFRRSAALGSAFAKSQLVQLNPYAAMCNKMLKSVFEALENGSDVPENPFKKTDDGKQG